MAQAVQVLVEESEGKEQHAIQSFANALRQLPTIMADNAGLGKIISSKYVFISVRSRLRGFDCQTSSRARQGKQTCWIGSLQR